MTDAAITDGFAKLKDGKEYDNLYNSAKCRSEADWLVGMNASRAFTLKYNALLTIGRVQTPTLAIIVARQKEIDAFKVSDYWEIEADFGEYKGTWTDIEKNDTKILKKEDAENIANKVKDKDGVITEVLYEEKKNPPPLLYDLTELQRDCNKKFGFTSQKTLNMAQSLYEKHKMITYPRTDSRYLSDDMIPKLKKLISRLYVNNEYASFAKPLTELEKLPITKRIVDNSKINDHHALIITDVPVYTERLSEDERKVYDLIARRFMAVFYPYYVYNTTKVVTEVEKENFVSRGMVVTQKGWTELNVVTEKESKKDKNVILPDVNKGDVFTAKKVKVNQKKTKPPVPYNEAALLSAMENAGRFVDDEELKEQLKDSGLGTPATRAAIIERLIKVGYIVRKGKNLNPTEKGMKLIEIVPPELKSAETTGRWEKGLTSVAKGKMDSEKFMNSIKRYVCYIVDQSVQGECKVLFPAEQRGRRTKNSREVLGICPNCKGNILENSKGYFCTNWKQGCKFTIWKNSLENYGRAVDNELVKIILSEEVVKGLDGVRPQTNEKCKFDLSADKSGRLSVTNVCGAE
jgi:DNA topoisomerase-3